MNDKLTEIFECTFPHPGDTTRGTEIDKLPSLTSIRIKKFMEVAEQYALDNANNQSEEEFEDSFIEDFFEKFEELIVQECILVIQKDVIRNGNTPENQRTTKHLMAIRDHFGYDNTIFETWKLLK